MNKVKITPRAIALAMLAITSVGCSKEKTAQQETTTQQPTESRNYTLAEMAEAMSWEDGKAFFENQHIKDYTAECEKVLNDCGFEEKTAVFSYSVSWQWVVSGSNCNPNYSGLCIIIKNTDNTNAQANAIGLFEDGKLVIIPTSNENGFTIDGYLAVGEPIEIQNDTIAVSEGVYTAYYDDELGRYVAVAVDYETLN